MSHWDRPSLATQPRMVDSQLVSSAQQGATGGAGRVEHQSGWSATQKFGSNGLLTTNYSESQQVTSTTYNSSVISGARAGARLDAEGVRFSASGFAPAEPRQYQSGVGYRHSLRGSVDGRPQESKYDFTAEQGFRGSRMSTLGHSARLVETKEGEARLVDVHQGESRVLEERTFEGETRIVGERELKRERKSETRQVKRENVSIEKVQQTKLIEVIKEVGEPYDHYVDVAYDVIIDVPIQRTIEREVITEILMEKAIEKIVEIPIEQIIEIPVERVMEVPREVRRTVNVPFERVVHQPYEVVRENVVYSENVIDIDEREIGRYPHATVLPTEVTYEQRQKIVERPVYIENLIESVREVRTQKIVEVPTERVVERRVVVEIDRPVPVEREVVHHVDVPVENVVYRNVDYVVERPVMRENIIEKRVPIERLVEREVFERVEHIVEVPVIFEKIIEKPTELLVEVPVPTECIVEVPVEELHEIAVQIDQVTSRVVEKIIRRPVPVVRQVEVPFDFFVERTTSVPVEHIIEKKINRFIEIPVEKIVEKQVEVHRVVQRPVVREVVREVPVEVLIENIITVEKLVEREVIIDTELVREVEVIVEQVIEVPVEKIIEVEVLVQTERPVFSDNNTEEFYNVETEVHEYTEEYVHEETVEADDAELGREIGVREQEVHSQRSENGTLKAQFEGLQRELNDCRESGVLVEGNENIRLKARLADLNAVFRALTEQKSMLYKKSINRNTVTETTLRRDPAVGALTSQLKALIDENHVLIKNIKSIAERVTDIVHKGSIAVSNSHHNMRGYKPRSSYTPMSTVEEGAAMRRSLVVSGVSQSSTTQLGGALGRSQGSFTLAGQAQPRRA